MHSYEKSKSGALLNVIISKLLEQIECCSEFPSSEITGAD
jgi:hypothetical protein